MEALHRNKKWASIANRTFYDSSTVHDSSSHILKAHHGCVSMHVLARARPGMGHNLGGLTRTVAKHAHPRPA